MSYEATRQTLGTILAGADLSTHQFEAVKLSAGAAILGTTLGEVILGVLQNNPTSGRACAIDYGGVVQWKAHAAVAVGAQVTSSATGRAVTASATDQVHGIALAAASGAGAVIPVLLKSFGPHP